MKQKFTEIFWKSKSIDLDLTFAAVDVQESSRVSSAAEASTSGQKVLVGRDGVLWGNVESAGAVLKWLVDETLALPPAARDQALRYASVCSCLQHSGKVRDAVFEI